MKKILLMCVTVMMTLTTLTAFAADVSGTWTGDVTGQDFHLVFNLKQDGTKLTGSIDAGQGDAIAITDGTVDGNKISFKVSFNGTTITHSGTIDGDTIKLTSKSEDASFPGMEMTLARSKAAAPAGK